MKMKPKERLAKAQEAMAQNGSDCMLRESMTGVPHIIGTNSRGLTYSIAYFGKTRSWRIFWPYPGFRKDQNKMTLPASTTSVILSNSVESLQHA